MKHYFLLSILFCIALVGCSSQAKRLEQAQTLYEKGTLLREQRLSEEAAKCFLQGLAALQGCENNDQTLLLKGLLKDNLGAMYNKHELFEEALNMHSEAIACFRQINDSTHLMTAMRNCGRVANSLEQFIQAKRYYDTAFNIATLVHDQAMVNDLYLEMARDCYLPMGNYDKAIESINQAMKGGLEGNNLDIAHLTLGAIYYYINNYALAKQHLNAALRSERVGVKMSVYQTLHAIAYNEDDLENAIDYQDLFTEYMLKVQKEHSSENMQRLKAEYELKTQKSEMESQHRNKSLKLYLIIAISVIAFLIILLIIRKKVNENKIKSLEKELRMQNKVMLSNKVFVTAKNLGEQVSAATMKFQLSEEDWDDFVSLTDLVYDGFSQRLLSRYPKLGPWDVRICCLAKNSFSNVVISILLDTQTESYYKRKVRIKQQKMDLPNDNRSLEEIINEI